MKKVIKLVLISAILIFTSRLAMTEENIAFVSADYLFQNHPERKAIAAKLETEFKATVEKLTENKKKVDARIADVQKKVEAKVAALQKDAPKLRAADIKKREDEINKFASTEQATINKLVAEHDQQVRIYQDNYAKRENQETSKLVESIQAATNAVAKEKHYTIVLDDRSVVFAADGKNISDDVLKAISTAAAKAK